MARPLPRQGQDNGNAFPAPGPAPAAPLEKLATCDWCRLTGSFGCAGVGLYLVSEMRHAKDKGHAVALAGLAATFAGLGYYRWYADE